MHDLNLTQAKLSDAAFLYNTERPLVVSHRGSTGHFPEHSIGAYADAYYSGADFVELDIQMTSDGYLVTNHDPCLKETTNVEDYSDLYQDRRKTKIVQPGDHHYTRDFFFDDFTLAEVKALKRKQRFANRSQKMDGVFEVLTLQETIDNISQMNRDVPRVQNVDTKAGLYIEIKQYAYYQNEMGVDMAEKLFELLDQNGLAQIADCESTIPIIIQSFEEDALTKFATLSDLPLIQLASYSTTYDFAHVATYAHGVGPDSKYVMHDTKLDEQSGADPVTNDRSKFIDEMHGLNLAVHPYTLRDDQLHYRDTAYDETQLYVDKGIDGIFTEFPSASFSLLQHMGSKASFPPSQEIDSTINKYLKLAGHDYRLV